MCMATLHKGDDDDDDDNNNNNNNNNNNLLQKPKTWLFLSQQELNKNIKKYVLQILASMPDTS